MKQFGSLCRRGVALAWFGWEDWKHLYLYIGKVRWVIGIGPVSLYWNRVDIGVVR